MHIIAKLLLLFKREKANIKQMNDKVLRLLILNILFLSYKIKLNIIFSMNCLHHFNCVLIHLEELYKIYIHILKLEYNL